MPATLDLMVQSELLPAESLAVDRALLAAVGDPSRATRGALRVYTLAGDVLSIGRFHRAPEPPPGADVRVARRWSGGRAMPWGTGFVGVTLVLPHRAALVAPDAAALAPAQVLNRCVRGILAACESLGVAAFYPGRDLVTVERRLLGMVSFAVETGGAVVFEAVLANGGDAGVLPRLLDRADPRGVVAGAIPTPADTASLASCVGRVVALDDLARRIALGYEDRLGVKCVVAEPPPGARSDEADWLAQRRVRDDLDRSFSVAGQLGVLEVHFARDGDRVRDVTIGGDLIAPADTVVRLEAQLRGCPVGRIAAAVAEVLAEPDAFVLGFGMPSELARAIAQGIAS